MNDFNFSELISGLETNGYVVIQQFLAEEIIANLRELALSAYHRQLTHKAQTGLSQSDTENLRGDHIIWLDDASGNANIQHYLSQMITLKIILNKAFYLSLESLESHFSVYPIGTSYAKHLDQFHAQKTRKISSILYLNDHWQADDGGCLRLYLSPLGHLDIQPIGGQLVLFDSARFFHEVLPAKRERVSIAGWFKTRPN